MPLLSAWEDYVVETKIAPATRKRWLPVLLDLARSAGTDDLSAITARHVLDWKAELLRSDLEPRTVKNVHVAAAKAVFGHLLDNGRIAANPAAAVKIRVAKQAQTRDQGYTRDEAFFVLDHSCRFRSDRAASDRVGLVRWVPWLCAYTGARVNEITQMRPIDVFRNGRGDRVIVRITPEAGTQKAQTFRDVLLHPHLTAQGFLGYVRERGDRPLFFEPGRSRGGVAAALSKKAGERLAAWIRSIGIGDKRIRPNHAWRHRFATMSRAVGMRADVCDLILGHAPNGAARAYGNYWGIVLATEMDKFPAYEIEDLELVSEREVAEQIAGLPFWARSSEQTEEDVAAIRKWRKRFTIPELPPLPE